MPSYIAWGGAIVSGTISSVFPFPLALLQLFIPVPPLFQVLRLPFARGAAVVLLLASVLQAGVLIEELLMDKVGSSLNSAAKSSSLRPSLSRLSSLRSSISQAEQQLANFTSSAYPATVSSLLDKPLALPVLDDDSDIVFSAADVQEWEEGSALFRSRFLELADQAARQWVELIGFIPHTSSPSDPADKSTLNADPSFLALVQAEMLNIQSGTPTRAIYAEAEYTDEDWARDAAVKEEKEQEKREKADREFEGFLDQMFERAEALGKKDERAEAKEGAEQAENPLGEQKRARALLEQAQNPSLPVSPSNPTWRMTLRTQWEQMNGPQGVLGEAMGSLSSIFDDLSDEEEEDGEAASTSWAPKPLPLMANHLLRSHVQQALVLSGGAGSTTSWEKVWGVNPQEEEQVLPAVLSGVPSEYLTLIQRAVRIDQCARHYATSLLSLFLTPPSPPPPSIDTTDARSTAALLRSSPLPSFYRTVTSLFALPMDSKHLRIGVSNHEMAFVIFANQGQMEKDGRKGKLGRVAVEWARKHVEALRREVEEVEEALRRGAEKEGKEEL
ncbi:hypothetical protein JCM8547_003882 [Rhodosporidiobolus lusitaniae]